VGGTGHGDNLGGFPEACPRDGKTNTESQIKPFAYSCMSNNIIPVRRDGTASVAAFSRKTAGRRRKPPGSDTIGKQNISGSEADGASGQGLCKIMWLKKHEPDTFRQTWKS